MNKIQSYLILYTSLLCFHGSSSLRVLIIMIVIHCRSSWLFVRSYFDAILITTLVCWLVFLSWYSCPFYSQSQWDLLSFNYWLVFLSIALVGLLNLMYSFSHVTSVDKWSKMHAKLVAICLNFSKDNEITRHIEKNGTLYTLTTYYIENKVMNFKLNNFW